MSLPSARSVEAAANACSRPRRMMEERFSKIERENRILLEKMSHIMQNNTLDNKGQSWMYAHSLNKEFRKRELQRITKDNQVRESRVV